MSTKIKWAIAIVALLGAGIGVYFFIKKKKESNALIEEVKGETPNTTAPVKKSSKGTTNISYNAGDKLYAARDNVLAVVVGGQKVTFNKGDYVGEFEAMQKMDSGSQVAWVKNSKYTKSLAVGAEMLIKK